MSLAKTLSQNTLDRIQKRFNLKESGSPYMELKSPMSPAPVGAVRVWGGDKVHKMVYIGVSVPPIGLDSHMIFAFTPPASLIPHFTLDSVFAGHFAFHIDLIPRVDLGANLNHINQVFQPLTAHFDEAKKIEGLSPAQLSPRQYAIMSPWMLAYRATESAFTQIEGSVNKYLDHWFDLMDSGVTADVVATDPAARDRLNRAALFNPEVDHVWAQIDRLVGAETSAKMREVLKNQEVEK